MIFTFTSCGGTYYPAGYLSQPIEIHIYTADGQTETIDQLFNNVRNISIIVTNPVTDEEVPYSLELNPVGTKPDKISISLSAGTKNAAGDSYDPVNTYQLTSMEGKNSAGDVCFRSVTTQVSAEFQVVILNETEGEKPDFSQPLSLYIERNPDTVATCQ